MIIIIIIAARISTLNPMLTTGINRWNEKIK